MNNFRVILEFSEPGSLVYEENLTRSLLKALKFGSKESQILFPTLLHLSHITSDSVKEIFLSEVCDIINFFVTLSICLIEKTNFLRDEVFLSNF